MENSLNVIYLPDDLQLRLENIHRDSSVLRERLNHIHQRTLAQDKVGTIRRKERKEVEEGRIQ